MTDLETTYLGLSLRSPLVASPGPLTGHVDSLLALEDAGVSAVVLPSLFEEEVVGESMELHERLETGAYANPEAGLLFPELDFAHLGVDKHVRLVEEATRRLTVPVVASVNAASAGSWIRYARLMADAGADAVELNVYDVAADPRETADDVESRVLHAVRAVRAEVAVPVAVKLGPHFSAFANFAQRLVDAGADGLVLFNRFYQPDINLDSLDVEPRLELSQSSELRLPLRWIGILRPQLGRVSLAATSGVHTGLDVAKALLAGADVTMMTSALLRHGPSHVGRVEAELVQWMAERDDISVAQLRGSVARHTAPDPKGYERAQYVRTLASYTRRLDADS